VLLVMLAAASPWIGYAVGLANVDGRPFSPRITGLMSVEQLEVLHLRLRKSGAFVVPNLSPFAYALALASDPDVASSGGVRVAGFVAEDYTRAHLRWRNAFWSRLSSEALTVWLMRNWSSDEVVARAYEIASTPRSAS
jgi:hypothetical protein